MQALHTGDLLDNYRLDELIARSGMATIYKATDTRDGKLVAVKIPHPEMEADPVLYERFQREIEIGKVLDHPGVVRVLHDPQQSRVYMIMEWAEGRLLRHVVHDDRPMPHDRALGLAYNVCDALEYIHSRGVVHRDLKPENVMVDEQDRTKLIDFGIAFKKGAKRLTFGKLSNVMGSPDYIAPEQVEGKRGDARTDIYALGVILYEMLTAQTPFQGDNPFAVMNDRLLNNPKPPRVIDPTITPEMQEIVYRAMARDPEQRYASALDFAKDLANPDQVQVQIRQELTYWKERKTGLGRKILNYVLLALIPVAIFSLLLWVAKHAHKH